MVKAICLRCFPIKNNKLLELSFHSSCSTLSGITLPAYIRHAVLSSAVPPSCRRLDQPIHGTTNLSQSFISNLALYPCLALLYDQLPSVLFFL